MSGSTMHARRMRAVVGLTIALSVALAGCTSSKEAEPPDESPPQVGNVPGLIWLGDMETGDLSQFHDTPFNTAGGAQAPALESDPAHVRDGRYSIRMTIPGKSDGEGICCGTRSEVEPLLRNLHEGDDLYFGFSTMLAAGFPVQENWQVITQWKGSADGSPPVQFTVENGQYQLSGGADDPHEAEPFVKPLAPAVTGEWSDWIVHIKFSTDPAVGYAEVWKDGELVLPRYSPPTATLYPTTDGSQVASYLKVGYYREPDIDAPGTVYFDDWRVGTTRDAVTRPAS